MSIWIINPLASAEMKKTFTSLESALTHREGEIVSASSMSEVRKYIVKDQCVYIKYYFYNCHRIIYIVSRKIRLLLCQNIVLQVNLCYSNFEFYHKNYKLF